MAGLRVRRGPQREAIPLLIGVVLVALYFYNRIYGLLVVGAILTGIGAGRVAEDAIATSDDLGSLGLGVGFLGIYVIDRLPICGR